MKIPVMLAVVSMGAVGCAGETVDDETMGSAASLVGARTVDEVVAVVTTKAGSRVEFVAGVDDELGTAILRTLDAPDAELDALTKAVSEDPVQLYEALAKRPAPSALRVAVDAAKQGRFTAELSDVGESAGASTGSLSAPVRPSSASAADLCNITNSAASGHDPFEFCFLNYTHLTWFKDKVDHAACRIDVREGSLDGGYSYKTVSGWHHDIRTLHAGQSLEWNRYYRYAKRWRHCRITSNPNHSRHHLRVVGHENLGGWLYSPDPYVSFPSP